MVSASIIAKTLFQGCETIPELFTGKRIVFLRAQMTPAIHIAQQQAEAFILEQSFAPDYLPLKEQGYDVQPEIDSCPADVVLYLATRSNEENLAEMARGWEMLPEGGWLAVAQHNDLGAKRLDAQLKKLAGGAHVQSYSKNHCRAIIAQKTAHANQDELTRWQEVPHLHQLPDAPLVTRPGVFSWKKVDEGSALLVQHLPKQLAGRGVDLCAGWGYLAWEAMQGPAKEARLTLLEAEKRALDLAQENLGDACSYMWADAARPWPQELQGVDWVISNPPAHDLYDDAPAMVAGIFRQCAAALKKGGSLWLVANRHLPYERLLAESFSRVEQHAETGRFKVMEAVA